MIEKEEDGITYLVPETGGDIQTIREGIAAGEILSKPGIRDFHRYRVKEKGQRTEDRRPKMGDRERKKEGKKQPAGASLEVALSNEQPVGASLEVDLSKE